VITTPTQARTACYDRIKNIAGVTVQPAVKLPLGKTVTIATSPAGMNADDFLVRVSVYASAGNNVVKAIENVETYSVQVDNLLLNVPRSEWTTQYEPDLEAWHAFTVVNVGREDF